MLVDHNGGKVHIRCPRWEVGDRLRVKDDTIGNPEVVVERIEGPTIYHGSDLSDAFMYYVFEPARNERYPCLGKGLERIR